jgi:hypothetical protein
MRGFVDSGFSPRGALDRMIAKHSLHEAAEIICRRTFFTEAINTLKELKDAC